MNVLLAPDAFKDSLSASEVTQAMRNGVLAYDSKAKLTELIASDGGEGFLDSVGTYIKSAVSVTVPTVDPLGRAISGRYLYDEQDNTAYVELAQASGLELLSKEERNPMHTSTYGTGVQINDAIAKGATHIYLGLGGSATNDAATGLAHALGYRFITSEGKEIIPNGGSLSEIDRIEKPKEIDGSVRFFAVNDVSNPLHGPAGAAFVYGSQKGANAQELLKLDMGLMHLDKRVQQLFQLNEAGNPGSGAAGGAAYGLRCFLGATYLSGTRFILKLANFSELVLKEKLDVIITGEGKIDQQTAYGKFVYGLIQEANRYQIPVIAICGKLGFTAHEAEQLGLEAVAELYDPSKPASYSFTHAAKLIATKTEALLRSM